MTTTTASMGEPMSLTATIWGTLSGPLDDPITRRALLEVALLGIGSGAVGCWVVLYGLSYSSESLSHSMLPGLVVATLAGAPLLVGGTVGILVAALAIALVTRVPTLTNDTAVAIVVTSLFGLGALLALSPSSPPGIQQLLFGDVLGASDGDLLLAAIVAAVAIGGLRLLHDQLLVAGFDRQVAPSLGAHPAVVDMALLGLIALTVLAGVQSLGNLLIVAILIGPAAAARQLCSRLGPMVAAAITIAILGGVLGLYLSYYAGTAAGASIAASLIGLYILAALATAFRQTGAPVE